MTIETLPTRIVFYPDPVLRRNCEPIETFDESVRSLAECMLDMMKSNNGVGLAGPQVGIDRCIFVCNPTGEPEDDQVYINPEITDPVGAASAEEGCLSLPDLRIMVRRARRCGIRAFDVEGHPIERDSEDLLARIWQHETDHLHGRLIIDYMSPTDKIANKKLLAELEADYARREKRAGRAHR